MKHRRIGEIRKSVSAKLNILIVTIILIVSALLMFISNRAYRQAVFGSAEQKLNGVEIPVEEEIVPSLNHFQQIFKTEAFQDARAKYGPDERNDDGILGIAAWMGSQPDREQANPDEQESGSLLNEWIDVASWGEGFGSVNGLYSYRIEVWDDGKTRRIYDRAANEDTRITVPLNTFGQEGSYYPELSAGDFRSASLIRIGGKDLYMRCLQGGLEGGGAYRIWISLDMTDAISGYRGFLITSFLSVLGLIVLINGIMMLILRRQVSQPVSKMARSTRAFRPESDGTYSADSISKVQIRTADELGDLSRDIRAMQEQIVENTGNLARMAAERERINTEMNLARNIQVSALPSNFPAFPERKEFDLYASMTPAREVGGDFYDYFLIDDDHLALVIADVSGKGFPSALFMMTIKTLIQNQLQTCCDPAAALDQVNRQLCGRNPSMMFVTVWLAVVEISTGKGLACNAGHEHPALRRADGAFELLKYPHNLFVGGLVKARYRNREFELHPGDCVFVYTDGVPEAVNPADEMFGEERLAEALNQCPDAEPEKLIRHVHEAVNRFADNAEQFDDITMLCLKYYGAQDQAHTN